jgi:hypothetical protein
MVWNSCVWCRRMPWSVEEQQASLPPLQQHCSPYWPLSLAGDHTAVEAHLPWPNTGPNTGEIDRLAHHQMLTTHREPRQQELAHNWVTYYQQRDGPIVNQSPWPAEKWQIRHCSRETEQYSKGKTIWTLDRKKYTWEQQWTGFTRWQKGQKISWITNDVM